VGDSGKCDPRSRPPAARACVGLGGAARNEVPCRRAGWLLGRPIPGGVVIGFGRGRDGERRASDSASRLLVEEREEWGFGVGPGDWVLFGAWFSFLTSSAGWGPRKCAGSKLRPNERPHRARLPAPSCKGPPREGPVSYHFTDGRRAFTPRRQPVATGIFFKKGLKKLKFEKGVAVGKNLKNGCLPPNHRAGGVGPGTSRPTRGRDAQKAFCRPPPRGPLRE
jgi:hypothetical protein